MEFDQKDFASVLGSQLQERRLAKGLTLDQTVEQARLSVSRSSLSAIENGSQEISARDLYALSTVFEFSVGDLIDKVIHTLLEKRFSGINLQR